MVTRTGADTAVGTDVDAADAAYGVASMAPITQTTTAQVILDLFDKSMKPQSSARTRAHRYRQQRRAST